ncbi:MAG: DUF2812 domain-containing protein [Clostridia bacterium]|nr:DUF2812 domain-containing protein [Clostridia bacterium]
MKHRIVKEEMVFNYTELTAIEQYLTQKEKDGLKLQKIENGRFYFLKSDHRKIRYSAVIFTGHSVKNDFITTCENQGWEFVCSYLDEMYIFRTQNSDAVEIMTDEKENFKTVAKRAFLQPGYITFSFYALFLLFKVIFFRNHFEGIIATDAEDCTVLMFVLLSFLQTAIKLLHFACWYQKSRKLINENKKIPFSDLKKAEKTAKIWNIINLAYPVLLLLTALFVGSGYSDITAVCWVCGIIFIINLFILLNEEAKKTKNKRKYAVFAFASLLAVLCIFTATQWSKGEYNNNFKELPYADSVPVSVADLVENTENCTNKIIKSKATRFGQHYKFSSVYKTDNEEEYFSIYYQVLISEHPWVLRDYVNLINKENDGKLIKADNNYGWNELYLNTHNYKPMQTGYAIKGNTVIVVERSELPDEVNFYKTAHEKLF